MTAAGDAEGGHRRVLEAVARRLAADPAGAGAPDGPAAARLVFDGSFSSVYRLPVPGGAVAVKLFKDQGNRAEAVQAARDYHAALVAMDALRAGSPRLGAARPVALFDDEAAVACEWLDGRTVSDVLRTAGRTEARRAARDAGAWLARLHGSSPAVQRPVALGLLLADLDRAAARVDAPPAPFAQAVALLRATAPALAALPVPWAKVHGDFKPDNLFACADGLKGIDIALMDGPVPTDLAHFTNHAALLYQPPRHPWQLGFGREVEAAFRAGYVAAGGAAAGSAALPLLPMAWYELHNAVRLYAARRQWSAGLRAKVGGWLLLRLLRRRTRALRQASPP